MTEQRSETTNGVVDDLRPEPPAVQPGIAAAPST